MPKLFSFEESDTGGENMDAAHARTQMVWYMRWCHLQKGVRWAFTAAELPNPFNCELRCESWIWTAGDDTDPCIPEAFIHTADGWTPSVRL